MMIDGISSSRRDLTPAESAAPPETTARSDDRSYVVCLDLVDQRAGEGVADDEQDVHALGRDRAEDVGAVEAFGHARDHQRAALGEGVERHPVRGAVHERRAGHHLRGAVG